MLILTIRPVYNKENPYHANDFIVLLTSPQQVTTTKGTGGDIVILEEAAYVDPGFFYETVAPLMIVGTTTLIGISTLTSEINFYTRLIRLKDKATGLPLFTVMQIELACAKCKEDGKAADCVHLLHLVPRWQSSERHRKLKVNFNLSIIIYLKFDEYTAMTNY
jgi:hypothetical protein